MSRSADAFRVDGQDLVLHLYVTPGARWSGFDGLIEGPQGRTLLRLKVRAKAKEGEANEAVIKALAELLRRPRSTIALESGRASRVKTLRIAGGATVAPLFREIA